MMRSTHCRAGALILLTGWIGFASCANEAAAKPQGPDLPAPKLTPFIDELKAMRAAQPQPDEAALRELKQYADVALGIVEGDARITARAERALLEHPFAWHPLEQALEHEDVAVRRRAAWLCGKSGHGELQLPLVIRFKYEKDPEAVVWIADALQKLGNDSGAAWLDAAMSNEATAEVAGQRAIEICNARGIELSESPTYVELRGAMQDIHAAWLSQGKGGNPDVEPPSGIHLDARLAKRLATTELTYLRPIDDAKYILTRCGRLAVPLLERALGASEHYLRTVSLHVLQALGPCASSTGPAVRKLLGDPMTRTYAVRTLGEIGDTDALPVLRQLLDAIEIESRAEAAYALGLLRDEQSRDILGKKLADETEAMDVRVNAAFALLCFGEHPEATAFLQQREEKGDYHAPTLRRLRDRLATLAKG